MKKDNLNSEKNKIIIELMITIIVYEVNVANCGRMDARLDNMLVSYDNKNNSNGTIKYTITEIEHNDIIKAGENKKIYIKVEWDSNSKNYTSDVSSNILVNLQFVQN